MPQCENCSSLHRVDKTTKELFVKYECKQCGYTWKLEDGKFSVLKEGLTLLCEENQNISPLA
jgi:transposase-like protein